MSSGFVSGGTTENPAERDDAWREAQTELEEKRRRKEEEEDQNEGKSLYEVLQANKAAKQEAFEEATRLKNQFRALDDDEADFLDSVLESTRKQEAAVRKDTLEQLDVFRKQQEEAERKALAEQNAGSPVGEETQWIAGGRKRKKGGDKDGGLLKGVKLRKASSSADTATEAKKVVQSEGHAKKPDKGQEREGSSAGTAKDQQAKIPCKIAADPSEKTASPAKASTTVQPKTQALKTLSLGLGYASSDEDD